MPVTIKSFENENVYISIEKCQLCYRVRYRLKYLDDDGADDWLPIKQPSDFIRCSSYEQARYEANKIWKDAH